MIVGILKASSGFYTVTDCKLYGGFFIDIIVMEWA